jgi:hypothetical protein
MHVAKQLLGAFVLLTLAYLLLIHATGFATDIASIGSATGSLAKTFQGR